MVLGIILLNKKYTAREYVSIVMITIGITLATLASSKQSIKKNESDDLLNSNEFTEFLWWFLGKNLLQLIKKK
jgi:hypothetical protein